MEDLIERFVKPDISCGNGSYSGSSGDGSSLINAVYIDVPIKHFQNSVHNLY